MMAVPDSLNEPPDVFREIDQMRRTGWSVKWNMIAPGKLGAGCCTITVERDGLKGSATAQDLARALKLAIERRARSV